MNQLKQNSNYDDEEEISNSAIQVVPAPAFSSAAMVDASPIKMEEVESPVANSSILYNVMSGPVDTVSMFTGCTNRDTSRVASYFTQLNTSTNDESETKKNYSEELINLIKGLTKRNPSKRVGSEANGGIQINRNKLVVPLDAEKSYI
uniref:Uncharacterized protein n=1 Tax=Ditylenchus dipsaci TaxID=166011 RepID=A0A915DQ93_9BILA